MASSAATSSTLAVGIKDDLERYFRHLAGRVDRAVRSVPKEKVWTKPFSFGNSLGHLVLHLTGNLNHYIGAGIGKTGYVRDRPKEFSDPTEYPPEEILSRFHEAIETVVRIIHSLDDDGLLQPVSNEPPITTNFGLLLVCAAHLNNHIGQMAYLVPALGHSTNEPPIW
jgi:uncharacterized damage-inducible protein DinB